MDFRVDGFQLGDGVGSVVDEGIVLRVGVELLVQVTESYVFGK